MQAEHRAALALVDSASLPGAIEAIATGAAPPGIGGDAWRRAVALYEAQGFAPQWVSVTSLLPRAHVLVDVLGRAHEHGLRPADYLGDAARAAIATAHAGIPALARADVLLTAGFAAYAGDMLTGRLDPRRVEPAWYIDAHLVDVDAAMRGVLQAGSFGDALAALAPQEPGYAPLVRALARYRGIATAGGWPVVPSRRTLRPGDSAASVSPLRARLRTEGYVVAPEDFSALYDHELAGAVARFQRRHGLAVDSVVGPRTREALNVPVDARVRQIEASLERYRWLPRELGARRIVVNIPAFRLDAYEEGRRVLSMAVVVGRELADRRTPVFSDSMRYVQFGPRWNVPRGIALEEILPEARRDRGYLERNGYEVVRGWGDDAPVVDPWSLSDAELTSARYRVRQRPGPRNALGRVKFMFPNDFAVYLHDTPAQALFDERVRAYSHGCVRVADPAALARFVLGRRAEWTEERIHRTLEAGARVRIDLRERIPVYLIYLTAFDQGGEVAFRDDLYHMDRALDEALAGLGVPVEPDAPVAWPR